VVDRIRSVIRPFFDKQLYVNIRRLLLILFVRFSFDRLFSCLLFRTTDRPFFFYRSSLAVGHFFFCLTCKLFSLISCAWYRTSRTIGTKFSSFLQCSLDYLTRTIDLCTFNFNCLDRKCSTLIGLDSLCHLCTSGVNQITWISADRAGLPLESPRLDRSGFVRIP